MEEMKIAKAYLRYVRIAPRKVQIVCDLIRGKDAGTAMAILMQTPKAASEPVLKLLKITGDWQKFKGLDGAEGTLKTVEAGPDAAARVEAVEAEAQKLKAAKSAADAKAKAEAEAAAEAEAPAEEAQAE